MGASMGGILGVPLLVLGIELLGLVRATFAAAALCLSVLLPLSFLLRRRPQEMGLLPDGASAVGPRGATEERSWTRAEATKAWRFRSIVLAFGIAFLVQVGFLTHHVTYMAPHLGSGGASAVVAATAVAAFLGRIALARYVDSLNPRALACGVLGVGATGLADAFHRAKPDPDHCRKPDLRPDGRQRHDAAVHHRPARIRLRFIRRLYGLAAMAIGLCTAMGPSFYGTLYELFGGTPCR